MRCESLLGVKRVKGVRWCCVGGGGEGRGGEGGGITS